MDKHILKKTNNKGEVALIYIFIILSIMIVSAFTISGIAISTIKGSGTAEYVVKTQIASDSYLEKAMFDYYWSKDPVSPTCYNVTNVTSDTDADTKVTVMVDNGTPGDCPSLASVADKTAMLCVYSFAENHGVQKKQVAGSGKETPGCPVR
jgi:hypothetical protein